MIRLPEKFDDIRPYYDSEVPAAMERIASDPLLLPVLRFFGKEDEADGVRSLLRSITTTEQLQEKIMYPVLRGIISRTVGNFTHEGAEKVCRDRGLLYVSNHRDIVLDAFLQQLALVENGIPTSHITFGSNLMNPQFVVDTGLSNKMFRTVRKSTDFQEFLDSSTHLSEYINYVVSHGESVWIAQRNGRTKDGLDRTEHGLLRMLMMGDRTRSKLESLGITPVAVSYQWEPCDILKAVELYRSRGGKPYVKAPGEDLNSIITGIISQKGDVHVAICDTLDFSSMPERLSRADISEAVAMIDAEIYSSYRLWDTNYAAFDLLNGCLRFEGLYDPCVREKLESKMRADMEKYAGIDSGELSRIYLGIYAGPVVNSPVALK